MKEWAGTPRALTLTATMTLVWESLSLACSVVRKGPARSQWVWGIGDGR